MAVNITFPDDWLPGSGEEFEGMPYFILNPFAGESEEPIIKTREHRLVGIIRKTIYRETSADLVKMADGGDLETYLAALEARIEALEG